MDTSLILLGKAGFALFTLGLVLGVAIPKLLNPRMALSAHLTAVQTGPALIAFALFWPHLGVPPGWTCLLVDALLLSSFVLVLGIILAAAFEASEALPIAGEGHHASKVQEHVVTMLVRGSSVLMLVASLAICYFMVIGDGVMT